MTAPPSDAVVSEIKREAGLGGEATYKLLAEQFKKAAKTVPSGLVTDDGHPEEREDTFHRFLLAKLASLPAELATKVNDGAVAAFVLQAAKNFLIDRARKSTDHGSHRHTLEQLMRKDNRFRQHPKVSTYWSLAETSGSYPRPGRRLHEAAAAVAGIAPGRRGSEKARPSLAPGADLVRLLVAVLTEADGWVDAATLTAVIERRLGFVGLRFESLEVAPGEYRSEIDVVGAMHDEPPVELDDAQRVAEVLWAEMPEEERRILLLPEDLASPEAIGAIRVELGVGRSQANLYRQRLTQRLGGILVPGVSSVAVLHILEAAAAKQFDRTILDSVRHKTSQEVSEVDITDVVAVEGSG